MKKKALLTSAVSIALCASMIGGATYALFTSSSKVNVSVTSGKVDVVATVGDFSTYTTLTEEYSDEKYFENGGWVEATEDGVAITNITPGDGVKFNVDITNNSNVQIKYMVVISPVVPDSGLLKELQVSIDEQVCEYDPYGYIVKEGEATISETEIASVAVDIYLPEEVETQYEGTSALEIAVLAVQGNGEFDTTKEWKDTITKAGVYELNEDVTLNDIPLIRSHEIDGEIVVNGNGYTATMVPSETNTFDWDDSQTIPQFANIFSSANGSTVTVNDLTIAGEMQAVMLGHYVNATYNNYKTVFNNVNIVETEVVSFSQGISPAVCVYGTAILNNCNVYGTTLSEKDTDPMWPVYDLAVVNYSNTTINGGKIGSIYTWTQCKLTINGAEVESIDGSINARTGKDYGLFINAGSKVGTINLNESSPDSIYAYVEIANGATVETLVLNEGVNIANIVIADGATVEKISYDGSEYTLEEFKALQAQA